MVGRFSNIVLGVQIQIPVSLIPVMSMLSVLEAVRTIKSSCVNATPHFKATDLLVYVRIATNINYVHFVKTRNLPYSIEDVRQMMTKACWVCAENKPQFYSPVQSHLVKATQPFERLNTISKAH